MGTLETLRRRERTIAVVRWTLAVVAALEVVLGGRVPTGIGVVVVIFLSTQGIALVQGWQRLETAAAWRQAASVMMAVDGLAAALWAVGAVAGGSDLAWVLAAVLAMEGALRYRVRGAVVTAIAAAIGYVLIETAVGATPGRDLLGRSAMVLLLGGFAGAIAFELDVERRLFQRMAAASQDIVGRRDEVSILTALASHVAGTLDAPQAVVYRYSFTGWTERARVRRGNAAGIVHTGTMIADDEEGVSHLLHRTTWRAAADGQPARLTVPIRLPERPAEHVVAVPTGSQRPSSLIEGALLSLAEATAVSLATLDLLRHQEASNRRLERLEALRTRFVATVAHDLRSPLTTVKGVASILRDRRDSVPPEAVDTMLASVERQANRLNRLADDLLDAARLDSDQLDLNREDVDVESVLRAVAADAPDDVEVVVDGPIRVHADGPRLERVVWNLISNALKYGRSPVVVSAEEDVDAGQVRIRVRDHGKGLSAAQRRNLFTEFAAGDDPASVGLGLAIVWQLVQAHGGTVTYDEADPGACFTVTIPAAAVRTATA